MEEIAFTGAKFSNFLTDEIIAKLEKFNPDIIVVALGSNDIDQRTSLNKLENSFLNYEQFYLKLSNLLPNAQIKILEIEPRLKTRIDCNEYYKVRKALNRRLRRTLKTSFIFTECRGINNKILGKDQVHLNRFGIEILTKIIQNCLKN